MDELYPIPALKDHSTLLKLANDIASELQDLETILNQHGIDTNTWEVIANNVAFQRLLQQAVEAWGSMSNTQDRIKVKAALAIEDVLPSLHARLVNKDEHLGQQVEGLKWLRDLAGMTPRAGSTGESAGKVSITINMGADAPVKIEKDVTPQVIEATIVEGAS